jgi:AcrR family transcriptional regulator
MTTHEARAAVTGAGQKLPPRERILKAADELFERYGIRGVGVEAIAEAADTNKMTLYRHFASKDELVAAWLQQLVDEWNVLWDSVDRDLPDGGPETQIDFFLKEFGDAFEGITARGCPLLNSLAELPEKDHPARKVLDDYKASAKKRMTKLFQRIGIAKPGQAAEEIQLLIDGAKAGLADCGCSQTRVRFTRLAKTLLAARMPR